MDDQRLCRARLSGARPSGSMLRGPRLLFVLLCALGVTVSAAACGDRSGAERDASAGTGADSAAVGASGGAAAAAGATVEWPATGAIRVQRERTLDLTGDGTTERVLVSAHGPTYDALDVELAITTARGDTLWYEQWSSMHYFKYDAREGKPDSAVARIVRGHVDALLADDSFTTGGLPAALRRGGTAAGQASMREAVEYHLAELDWRRGADMVPSDPTPPDAYDRIRVENVGAPRVTVVIEELMARPAFTYYAGGEATYAIAWSEREHAFVRIYACC
jgi:hypothetical protein